MMLDHNAQQKVDDHYRQLLQSLSARKFRETVKQMKAIFNILPQHLTFISIVPNNMLSTGLGKREYTQILNLYTRKYPKDPTGHLLQNNFYRDYGTLEQFRQAWKNTEANAKQGFHFQPHLQASVFDAEEGQALTTLGTPGLGARVKESILFLNSKTTSPHHVIEAHKSVLAECHTLPAEPVNDRTVALNGTLTGINESGIYYFRFGYDPDCLKQTTPRHRIPAPRNGRVMDLGDNLFRSINTYVAHITFTDADDAPVSGISQPITKMGLAWPFGKDRNHKNGIGVIDLLLGWNSAAHDRPRREVSKKNAKYPSADYPGGAIDLRDAVISIVYRAPNFDPRDFRPVIWIHGRTGTALYPELFNDLAAWAVTGFGDTLKFVNDGKWHRLEFHMPAHSDMWSFCGSNTEEMGDQMARYCYTPIQELLSDNRGGNICLCFVGGNDLDTPVGEIEIAALELRYRSQSLLAPGQGAQLISSPAESVKKPELLTDGTIRVTGHWWHANIGPSQSLVLKWSLRERTPIDCIKLHQNPLAPANEVEIDLSDDDECYVRIWSGQMDDVPVDPADWGDAVAGGEGSGLCRVIVPEAPVAGRFVRITIRSAHRGDIVGLDAVEVFSDALLPVPDTDRVTCSELAIDLPQGEPVYTQLVAECGDNVYEGEILRTDLPAPDTPQILEVRVLKQQDCKITLHIRTRAGNSFATLHTTLIAEEGITIAEETIDVGKWDAPRDTIISFPLSAPPAYPMEVICHIENASGEDEKKLSLQ